MRSILFGAAAVGGLQLTWAENQSKPEGRRRDWGKSQAAIGKCGRERNPKKRAAAAWVKWEETADLWNGYEASFMNAASICNA